MKSNTTKVVKLYDYLRPIESLEYEYKNTQKELKNIYERFENIYNNSVYPDVCKALKNYKYISHNEIVPEGRYIRYIDISDPSVLYLEIGGIVIESGKWTLKLKSMNAEDKYFNIMKSKSMIFMKFNKNDYMRDMMLKSCN